MGGRKGDRGRVPEGSRYGGKRDGAMRDRHWCLRHPEYRCLRVPIGALDCSPSSWPSDLAPKQGIPDGMVKMMWGSQEPIGFHGDGIPPNTSRTQEEAEILKDGPVKPSEEPLTANDLGQAGGSDMISYPSIIITIPCSVRLSILFGP
ncbi:unnamed protein product [Calypogeia fissa]